MKKEKICFSFWLDKKEAMALRKKIAEIKKISGSRNRISIADIVYPAVIEFIESNK